MPPDTGMVPCTAAPGLGAAQLLCPPALRASLHPPVWPQLQPPGKHNNQQLHTGTFGTTLLLVPECRLSVQEQKKKEHLKKKSYFILALFFNHLKKRYSWKPPLVVNV